MPKRKPHVKSIGELLQAMPPQKKKWGNWRLVATHLKLVYALGETQWECYLEEMHDSAPVLDFIFRFNADSRATAADKADLLNALHDLIDPLTCFASELVADEKAVSASGPGQLTELPGATVDLDRNGDVE